MVVPIVSTETFRGIKNRLSIIPFHVPAFYRNLKSTLQNGLGINAKSFYASLAILILMLHARTLRGKFCLSWKNIK